MKIFATSDLHSDSRQVKKLAHKARKSKADLVVICGDITYFDMYGDGMIGPFLENKKDVLFVPGNHESLATAELLTEKYKIKNIHGDGIVVSDVGFFGCGAANIGVYILSEEEIMEYLERGFKKIKNADKKVMVTHIHPKGSEIEKMSFPGSSSVTKAIKKFKPDIHICGHIHEAEGMVEYIDKTKVFCVGKEGKIINI